MEGAASTPASAEDDSSGVGAVDPDPRRPAAASPIVVPEGQGYVDLLLRVSLVLLRKGHAPGVRHQGLKLILHLLRYRWEELRIEEWSAGKDNLFVAPDLGVASAVNHASVISSTEKGNVGALLFDSDDIYNEIMDVSSKRILQKSDAMSPELLELSWNEPHENNGFIQHCSILLDLIRFIAYERPIIAASRAVGSINYLIGDASAVSEYSKDLAANRGAELVLETVVSTIFNDSTKVILDTEICLQRVYKIFEGLILQLLSLKWTEPGLVVIMRFHLNALCPFLRHFPNTVAMVVTKLLELLSSINNNFHDPSIAQHARLQICQCIIHICQAVDKTSLPLDVKELFSVPQITEEAVIAFVATCRADHRMEQKQVGGEGNGDAVHPSFVSYSIPSPPSSYLTLGLRPWILNDENTGLSSLSYFHDLPTTQPSFDSSSAPSHAKSNRTLSHKKLDHNINPCPQLYHTSFPLHGSLPISWLSLGTKSQSRNEGKNLNLHPKHQISTESCSSSLVCSSSPCLPLVKQRQQLHANEELQTLVSCLTQVGKSQATDIFDQEIAQERNTVHGIVMGDVEGSSEFVDERKLGIVGPISCLQDKGQLPLLEHNILSEAFVLVTSFHRIQDVHLLLTDLLSTLNKIWIQSDWEYKIINHVFGVFTNDEFRRTFRLLVKSFEEVVGNRTVESPGAQKGSTSASACHMYSYDLAKLMLPLILQILRCIQMLWKGPITYDLSGVKAEDISSVLESGKLPDVDESKMLQNAVVWSQEIQEIGYNVIGLCASFEGAFYGLLDCSCIINVIMGNLESMKFNHLGKLIRIVFIPLVTYCPRECWGEWMIQLLRPLFDLCEDGLHYAWFTFLHEGLAKVPPFLGIAIGPEDIVHQFKKQLLLKITLSVSELLGVLGSEGLNSGLLPFHSRPNHHTKAGVQDLVLISNTSIIGYLLLHDCFERLSMYLLGCLVDYEAVEKASPFCHALIYLAIATNHGGLKHFILSEMLPTIIRLLVGDIPSAISKLSCSLTSATKEDARKNVVQLCQKIYEVYIDNQVMEGEGVDSKNFFDCFGGWLVMEFCDLHIRAGIDVPEDFPHDDVWNWEFNEEFERYLPTYINMLVQVDAMDDCLEVNYYVMDILLEKLKPEFKSMYGISSYTHPYLRIISNIVARKVPAVYYQSRIRQISRLLTKLIALKPYITRTDSCDEYAWERLPEICESQYDPMQWHPAVPIDIFFGSVLFFREPKFHPLIRESHMELLTALAHKLALAEGSANVEPLEPNIDDFPGHLQPYAWMYIKRKKKESGYDLFKEQACLHEEFDNYLASGTLDNRMDEFNRAKDDFVAKIVSDLDCQFAKLHPDLIKMSFERRVNIVEWEHLVFSYSECLESLLVNDKMKDELGSLMNLLDAEGFFRVDSTDWDEKVFAESIEKFQEVVFAGQRVDRCLVIRGIIDYHEILQMKEVDLMEAFRRVVKNTNRLWKENVQEFWETTRHYDHHYYDVLAQPLQKVFVADYECKRKHRK